jgi:hypothetical protein
VEEQQDLPALNDDIPTSESKALARGFGSAKVFILTVSDGQFHFIVFDELAIAEEPS